MHQVNGLITAPAHRDLAGFDFTATAVDAALARRLHSGECIASAQTAVWVGGPGTGKTHLATAIGMEAIAPATGWPTWICRSSTSWATCRSVPVTTSTLKPP